MFVLYHVVVCAQVSHVNFINHTVILCYFSMVNAMKVGEHGNKWAKKLSGGTKRKVNCDAIFLRQYIVLFSTVLKNKRITMYRRWCSG